MKPPATAASASTVTAVSAPLWPKGGTIAVSLSVTLSTIFSPPASTASQAVWSSRTTS
ncbi:MAG: hypothetical protein ACOY3Y_20665 [Acidobacteriota bacterium]